MNTHGLSLWLKWGDSKQWVKTVYIANIWDYALSRWRLDPRSYDDLSIRINHETGIEMWEARGGGKSIHAHVPHNSSLLWDIRAWPSKLMCCQYSAIYSKHRPSLQCPWHCRWSQVCSSKNGSSKKKNQSLLNNILFKTSIMLYFMWKLKKRILTNMFHLLSSKKWL